jgi:hypothetical protein
MHVVGRQVGRALGRRPLDGAHVQSIALHASLDHLELALADTANAEQAVRHLEEIDDARARADIRRARDRSARFDAGANQHYAERRVLAHAVANHVDVARLEDAQRQRAAGEQYGIQREQRDFHARRGVRGFRGSRL